MVRNTIVVVLLVSFLGAIAYGVYLGYSKAGRAPPPVKVGRIKTVAPTKGVAGVAATEDYVTVTPSALILDQKPCAMRRYSSGFVCVCNSTYCDNLVEESVTLEGKDQMILITSSEVS